MRLNFDREHVLDDALAHHQAARFELAEQGYRHILDVAPDDLDTLNFLGVLLQETGDYAGSQETLLLAVGQLPDFAEALTNLARVQQITGQPAVAAASARRAIASDPTLFEAYQQLGKALLDLKDYAAAVAPLRQAIRLQPDDVVSCIHLCAALLGSGQTTEAAQALLSRPRHPAPENAEPTADPPPAHRAAGDRQAAAAPARAAIEADPLLSDAWCQLGYALVDLPDETAAIAAMKEAHRLAPHDRQALIGLATVLFRRKQYRESEERWREACLIFRGDGDILLGLSKALTEQGRHGDSVNACQQAVASNPDSARELTQLGWAHLRAQNIPKAIESLSEALRIDANLTDSLLLLAYAYAMMGNHVDAARCYREVLRLRPDNGEALAGLVKIRCNEPTDDVAVASAQIVGSPTSSQTDKIGAAFALAQEQEAQADHDAAFLTFKAANTLLRASRVAFDRDQSLAELQLLVDAAISVFSKNVVAALSPVGLDSHTPVFIVGMARSGTTLLEQIAASHPEVCGLGERGDFLELLGGEMRSMLLTSPDQWDVLAVRAAGRAFLGELEAAGQNARRIINKLPNNVYWLGHIAALFPNARIVVCRRDLRDVCWSCYAEYFFDDGMSWTDTLEGCAAQAREIERLLDHWGRVLPGRFLEVFYEDVVEDVEREARRLIDYLGLAWDPACLSFHRTERVVMTASHWQVRQPLYATSVGRWRHYRKHLGPLLEALEGLIPDDD